MVMWVVVAQCQKQQHDVSTQYISQQATAGRHPNLQLFNNYGNGVNDTRGPLQVQSMIRARLSYFMACYKRWCNKMHQVLAMLSPKIGWDLFYFSMRPNYQQNFQFMSIDMEHYSRLEKWTWTSSCHYRTNMYRKRRVNVSFVSFTCNSLKIIKISKWMKLHIQYYWTKTF